MIRVQQVHYEEVSAGKPDLQAKTCSAHELQAQPESGHLSAGLSHSQSTTGGPGLWTSPALGSGASTPASRQRSI